MIHRHVHFKVGCGHRIGGAAAAVDGVVAKIAVEKFLLETLEVRAGATADQFVMEDAATDTVDVKQNVLVDTAGFAAGSATTHAIGSEIDQNAGNAIHNSGCNFERRLVRHPVRGTVVADRTAVEGVITGVAYKQVGTGAAVDAVV